MHKEMGREIRPLRVGHNAVLAGAIFAAPSNWAAGTASSLDVSQYAVGD